MSYVRIYLHPAFIEDLTTLPPDLRIRLYAIMLRQYSPLRDEITRYRPQLKKLSAS